MTTRITEAQRAAVLRMLAEGQDRNTIAATVGITPGQVSAISAHVKMGTYQLPPLGDSGQGEPVSEHVQRSLDQLREHQPVPEENAQVPPILLGFDIETREPTYWNPDPATGSVNPHVLILGESGFGKTYTICCLLGELARRGIRSIVFDYGQGFSLESAPEQFVQWAHPIEIQASRDGINVNPLQIFPTDILGPVNVAQRVADTFSRVYTKIGVQQHAVLRQAILDSFEDVGIVRENESTWSNSLPLFECIREKLETIATNPLHPQNSVAATVGSHISTMFVFNTFRPSGLQLSWPNMFSSSNRVFVVQLKGLEFTLEKAVTEFLLWNLIGYIESTGPSPLRCFIVLDEAHRLAFEKGSPVEKLLREGRKFGLGLILASQQPEDFSQVAFANTATKLVFQVGDEGSIISRQLFRKTGTRHSFADIHTLITRLPRGIAYVVTENSGSTVQIASLDERVS